RRQLLHPGAAGRGGRRGLPARAPRDARGAAGRHVRPGRREGGQDLPLAGAAARGAEHPPHPPRAPAQPWGRLPPPPAPPPRLPPRFAESPYVFLANGSPSMQRRALAQAKHRKLVVADTMNFWIETQRDELYELLREVGGLVLNDGEARMLTDEVNLVRAGWK